MDDLRMHLFTICTLLLLGSTYAANKWKYQVKYGNGIIFNCSEPNTPSGARPISWLLPNLTIVLANETLPTGQPIKILDDGWRFQITNVTEKANGLYHCITQYETMDTNNNTHKHWFMIKRGLNIDGPYFGDLSKLYRSNIIYGFVAMGSFLVFITVIILVYTYRWQQPPQMKTVNIEVYQLPGYQDFSNGKANPSFLYDSASVEPPKEKIPPHGVTQM